MQVDTACITVYCSCCRANHNSKVKGHTVTLEEFNAEVAEAEERFCEAEVAPQTRFFEAEGCDEPATVQGEDGGWYCEAHDPARGEPDPDVVRDAPDYWLDNYGD